MFGSIDPGGAVPSLRPAGFAARTAFRGPCLPGGGVWGQEGICGPGARKHPEALMSPTELILIVLPFASKTELGILTEIGEGLHLC